MRLSGYDIVNTLSSLPHCTLARAKDSLGNPVLVKFSSVERLPHDLRARFQNEWQILHSHMLQLALSPIDFEERDDLVLMSYADINAISLPVYLRESRTLSDRIEIALNLLNAITEAHKEGIILRALSPDHFLLCPKTKKVTLTHFMLGSSLQSQRINFCDVSEWVDLGYTSPEMTGKTRLPVDYRSDFYSLGAILYYLFVGKPVFKKSDNLALIHAHLAETPRSPNAINKTVPKAISTIILKLLEKSPESRYQSSIGLAYDLQQCLEILRKADDSSTLELNIELAKKDIRERLALPQKLYGRDAEINQLQQLIAKTQRGQPSIIFIEGFSGIGKTALVDELLKPQANEQRLHIKGKCDQFSRNHPYSALAEGLSSLVLQLSAFEAETLKAFQRILQDELKENLALLFELIPSLHQIVPTPADIPELPVAEQELRFKRTFSQFLSCLSNSCGGLIIFLDDLQWVDQSTLSLLEHIFCEEPSSGLVLIVAYRDNEVTDSHPLKASLRRIEGVHGDVVTVSLGNLNLPHVNEWIAESLQCDAKRTAPLAQLCFDKTKGNPFFLRRFVLSIYEKSLLYFDHVEAKWQWQLPELSQEEVTDNVVDFMLAELRKLDQQSQQLLSTAACLGSHFTLSTLADLCEMSLSKSAQLLSSSVEKRLITPLGEYYHFHFSPELQASVEFRFNHDRIQQASLALTDVTLQSHWKQSIGKALLTIADQQRTLDEHLFTIVDLLNSAECSALPPSLASRLVKLNLDAAIKAKEASAHPLAGSLINAAYVGLTPEIWEKYPETAIDVVCEKAVILCLNGNYQQAEQHIKNSLSKLSDLESKTNLFLILGEQFQIQMRFEEALHALADGLSLHGITIPESDVAAEAILQSAYSDIEARLTPLTPQKVLSMGDIADPVTLQIMNLYDKLQSSLFLLGRQKTYCLIATEMVRITLEQGLCEQSSIAFRCYYFARVAMGCSVKQCYTIGELACRLAEQRKMPYHISGVYQVFAAGYQSWLEPFENSFALLQQSIHWGNQGINLVYGGYSVILLGCNMMVRNVPLQQVLQEMEKGIAFLQHSHQPMAKMYVDVSVNQPLLALMGKTESPMSCDTAEIKVSEIFKNDYQTPSMELALHSHAMIRNAYLLGNEQDQLQYVNNLPLVEAYMPSSTLIIDGRFYAGLSYIRFAESTGGHEWVKKAEQVCNDFQVWAKGYKPNFEHKWLLIKAELHKFCDEKEAAQRCYAEAIESARQNKFIACEALGNELYAHYWQTQKQHQIAQQLIQKAYTLYENWGAAAKLQQLQQSWSTVNFNQGRHIASQDVDLETMLRVNQLISSELRLDSLLDKLTLIALQNSGADRACLLTIDEEDIFLQTAGTVASREQFENLRLAEDEAKTYLASSFIFHVMHTKDTILVDLPFEQSEYASDPYFLRSKPLTVACLPIILQQQLVGFLYLENHKTAGAINDAHLGLLRSISVQAAVSLSNAYLYRTLEDKVQARTQDLSAAKQKAEEATEAKSSFLAKMSHEIRTPMNAVIGLSKLTLRTSLNKEQKDNLHNILESSETLLGLINDILDFSKIEAGKLELESIPFSLERVIQRAAGVVNLKAYEKGLEMVTYIAPEVPTSLLGDPLRLQQILTNLCSNAVKFTHSGSVAISVSLAASDAERVSLAFSVKDSGIGISTEQQKNLFQSFSQVDESITRQYGGTGLGLAICKQLVNMMGGSIWVESVEDNGSTFHFTVDLLIDKMAAERSHALDGEQLQDLKVLIADDIELSRQVIQEALQHAGIKADCAENGEQAVEKVRQSIEQKAPFDVVIMDWKMPVMNGVDAARYIREELHQSIPKIMMVTAYDKDEIRSLVKPLGITHFLEKPINQSHLLDFVMGVVSGGQGPKQQQDFNLSVPDLSGKRILLVEDNELNRKVAIGFLSDTKVQLIIAGDGREALDKLRQESFDLVLMDIQMPVMDGLTATTKARAELSLKTPIIAMTAHAMEGDSQKSKDAGMNAHITKPIDPNELYRTLASFLDVDKTIALAPASNIDPDEQETSSVSLLDQYRRIHGLNVDKALGNLEGKSKLYLQLIDDFCNKAPDIAQLESSIENNQLEDIFRLAHTLKSMSTYIGADTIAEKAAVVEHNYLDKKPLRDSALLLMNDASILCQQLSAVSVEPRRVECAFDNEAMVILMAELLPLIQNSDIDALEKAESLANLCHSTAIKGQSQKILDLCNEFDFEDAYTELLNLQSTLEQLNEFQ